GEDWVLPLPGRDVLPDGHHADAVHRAGGYAQLAAGAFGGNDGVHLLRRAGDGVHGAGLEAQRAADAEVLVDEGDRLRLEHRAAAKRLELHAEQVGKLVDAVLAAGRAPVDVRLPGGDRLGVGPAAGIAALTALR